jgi:Protein of unknown function (DUF2608)
LEELTISVSLLDKSVAIGKEKIMLKRNYIYIFLYFSFCSLFLQGRIIETDYFNEVAQYADSSTLLLLDIDDTILIPTQTLGTDVWFISRWKMYQQQCDLVLALDKALAEWEAVRHLTSVKTVEEDVSEVISELQQKDFVIMGLTTQGLALTTRTVNQLKSLNINLSITAPTQNDHYFFNHPNGVLFHNGILFTAGTPKGPALLKFLDMINYCPKRIVFINDKSTHLLDVENAVLQREIEFIGLRYNFSDKRVFSFDPEIADIQWRFSTFDHILSDNEAREFLKKKSKISK